MKLIITFISRDLCIITRFRSDDAQNSFSDLKIEAETNGNISDKLKNAINNIEIKEERL